MGCIDLFYQEKEVVVVEEEDGGGNERFCRQQYRPYPAYVTRGSPDTFGQGKRLPHSRGSTFCGCKAWNRLPRPLFECHHVLCHSGKGDAKARRLGL